MKWTTVVGSGMLAVIMASPVMAEEGNTFQERTESMEQRQLRLEQRFQKRSHEGEGMRHRYEEPLQHRSSAGQGGGARR